MVIELSNKAYAKSPKESSPRRCGGLRSVLDAFKVPNLIDLAYYDTIV